MTSSAAEKCRGDFNGANTSVKELDLTGLNCPMPILKTKQALRDMAEGERIKVLATDAHAEIDFKAYLSRTTSTLVELFEVNGIYTFIIEK